MTDLPRGRRERLEDVFWDRHSNPWSGWTRVALGPLLFYAVYRRDRRLLAAALAYTVVNPVLFPPPETTDSWISRGVLAERDWLREGNGVMSLAYPNVLQVVQVPVSLFALSAALRRRPLATALGVLAVTGLKLWWIRAIMARTGHDGRSESAP
jgi:hypothetical protein